MGDVAPTEKVCSFYYRQKTCLLFTLRYIVLLLLTKKNRRGNNSTQMPEEELQTSVICFCLLAAYLALAGLRNFLAELSDRIHHFTVYNLMPLAFLTKLSNMH